MRQLLSEFLVHKACIPPAGDIDSYRRRDFRIEPLEIFRSPIRTVDIVFEGNLVVRHGLEKRQARISGDNNRLPGGRKQRLPELALNGCLVDACFSRGRFSIFAQVPHHEKHQGNYSQCDQNREDTFLSEPGMRLTAGGA
jgi:hypothetical protein